MSRLAARARTLCAAARTGRPRTDRIRLWVLALTSVGAIAAAAPALAGATIISPLEGTPDAMPQSQISILGTPLTNIASVEVTGSESGSHAGTLEPYDSAEGASFLPAAPFVEGEEVNVTVDLKSGGPLSDHFTIAHLAPPEELLHVSGEKPEELEHFETAPELKPPKVKINVADPSLEGDIFTDPLPAPIIHVGNKLLEFEPVGPNGLMILDPAGKLLWWHQLSDEAGSNMEMVTYEGKPSLAWWQGKVTEVAYGEGEGVIANSSYEPVAHIKAGNGLSMDIHELNITPSGQAWIDAYELECLPTCSESNPPTIDAVAQEIDIKTGLVMWEWHAMSQIPLSESDVEPADGVFDAYHINAIQPLPSGHVLISLRDTSGVYDVEQQTGKIDWQIAEKKSSFTLRKEAEFYFQHDARLSGRRMNILTLFDDEAGPPIHGASRGLVLRLNFKDMRASVVHQYHRPGTVAPAEGSMQVMPDGDAVVGFGAVPYFSEFAQSGEAHKEGALIFDAQLPKGDGTYRVLRYDWVGEPKTLPAVVARRQSISEVDVYASWNGATKVAKWEVLAGEEEGSLTPAASAEWANFETKIPVTSTDSLFQVRALDSEGHVLASSEVVKATE